MQEVFGRVLSDTLTTTRYYIGSHHESMDINTTDLKIDCLAIHDTCIGLRCFPVSSIVFVVSGGF